MKYVERNDMFEQHPEFIEPDDTAVLWRYQDIPRYLDLLLKQKLFFSCADRFEDPFEGRITKKDKQEIYRTMREKELNDVSSQTIHATKAEVERLASEYNVKRRSVAISSWHNNQDENYAMWNIYARGNYGLAIQTTYERLKKSFDVTDRKVYIGQVKYYKESANLIPDKGSLKPFLCKRSLYEYENEVRCCYVIEEEQKDEHWEAQDLHDGVFIDADLEAMIERIYISPYSPKWIRDIIAGINEKFNLHKEIVHSGVFESENY